jgi:hypothetical protein
MLTSSNNKPHAYSAILHLMVASMDIQEMGFAYVYMACEACPVWNGMRGQWWLVLAEAPLLC